MKKDLKSNDKMVHCISFRARSPSGYYEFPDLAPDTYNVSEETRAGWIPTSATSRTINLDRDTTVNFTNKQLPPPVGIYGVVFNDANGNMVRDSGGNSATSLPQQMPTESTASRVWAQEAISCL